MVVWKYDVLPQDHFSVEMPVGAKVLTVQTQNYGEQSEKAVLWALVDPEARKVKRFFKIMPTGGIGVDEDFCKKLSYIGTFQFSPPMVLVFHLWEILS